MRQLTIAIPNYNRTDLLLESFMQVYDDPRVKEIVISDDHSDIAMYNQLVELFEMMPKVRMKRNEKNVDCYANKMEAVKMAETEYVILFDSDNVLTKWYLNKIYEYEWKPQVILTPSFAEPHFDFRAYEGTMLCKVNIASFIDKPMLEVCLNACNYFVCRDSYLQIWDPSQNPVTSDSILMATLWMKNNWMIYIVPGLTYHHRVHNGSHYQNNVHRTQQGYHENILQRLKLMS
jgi:glycosyltransferase involved in cell wall biosynthesis